MGSFEIGYPAIFSVCMDRCAIDDYEDDENDIENFCFRAGLEFYKVSHDYVYRRFKPSSYCSETFEVI